MNPSPMHCNHANEVPHTCDCSTGCYCRLAGNTCDGRRDRRFPVVILTLAVLVLASCATVSNPYAYNEAEQCPLSMTEAEQASGAVRCQALCSSYGRNFESYGADCKCRCASFHGGFRPNVPTQRRMNAEPQL